jgi:D-glycero-D-manno-heptose 1,7-bisphosphate phosphatase
MRSAVFLDRDGTLIEDVGYLRRVQDIALFPWTGDSIRLLNRSGLITVVVTNQSGVGRGIIPPDFVGVAHAALDARLAEGRARIDAYYFCPHHPVHGIGNYTQECTCRKPRPGMIQQARADLDIDLSRSWMVGNTWVDVECGNAVGVRSLLISSPHEGASSPVPPPGVRADAILNNLMEAVGWILRTSISR